MLSGKNILLGITGGIAAYKTTFLVRLLIKAGANVKIILTPSASSFVSPLTLATLSKNPVVTDFEKSEGHTTDWNNHVELGLWADLMLIAPRLQIPCPKWPMVDVIIYFWQPICRPNVLCFLHRQWIWICTNIQVQAPQ